MDNENKDTQIQDAVTHLCGAERVDAALAVQALLEEVKRLRAATAPVCPHCHVSLRPTQFKGYYDEFCYWECDCDSLPKAKTVRGAFA
jgi:hypothetical protein